MSTRTAGERLRGRGRASTLPACTGRIVLLDGAAGCGALGQRHPPHLNNALREVVNHGGGLGDLWLSRAALAAWIVGGFALSVRLFRWR